MKYNCRTRWRIIVHTLHSNTELYIVTVSIYYYEIQYLLISLHPSQKLNYHYIICSNENIYVVSLDFLQTSSVKPKFIRLAQEINFYLLSWQGSSQVCQYAIPPKSINWKLKMINFIYNYISYWMVFYQRVVWVWQQSPLFSHCLPSLRGSNFSDSRSSGSSTEKHKYKWLLQLQISKYCIRSLVTWNEINYLDFVSGVCLTVL